MNEVITLVKFFGFFDNSLNIKKTKQKKALKHKICFKILSVSLAATTASYGLSVGQFVSATSAKSPAQSIAVGNTLSFKSTSLKNLSSQLCTTALAWVKSNAQVLVISGCIVTLNFLKINSMSKDIKELKQRIINLGPDIEKMKSKVLSEITDVHSSETVPPPPPPPPPPPAPPRPLLSTPIKLSKLGEERTEGVLGVSSEMLRGVKLKKVTSAGGETLSPSAMSRVLREERTKGDPQTPQSRKEVPSRVLVVSPGMLGRVKLKKVTPAGGKTLSPLAMSRVLREKRTEGDPQTPQSRKFPSRFLVVSSGMLRGVTLKKVITEGSENLSPSARSRVLRKERTKGDPSSAENTLFRMIKGRRAAFAPNSPSSPSPFS